MYELVLFFDDSDQEEGTSGGISKADHIAPKIQPSVDRITYFLGANFLPCVLEQDTLILVAELRL